MPETVTNRNVIGVLLRRGERLFKCPGIVSTSAPAATIRHGQLGPGGGEIGANHDTWMGSVDMLGQGVGKQRSREPFWGLMIISTTLARRRGAGVWIWAKTMILECTLWTLQAA